MTREHMSVRRNPLIANIFYRAGFIESWGRGVSKVCQAYKEAGLPEPTFENYMSGTLVTIPRDPSIYGDYSDSRGNVTDHETDHETDQVTDHVRRLVKVVHGVAKTREEIMALLKLKHRGNLRDLYLNPAIDAGYVVMLYPDNPKRKGQAYYLTEKGKSLYLQLIEE